LDKWAAVEKATARNNPAFWWVDDNGNELQWSFGELVDISKRVANLLTDVCKLKRGSKLILVLPRLPEWWIFNVACIRTGIVVSPGTTQLTAYDLQYRLATSEAACIVADESTAVKLDSIPDYECPNLKVRILINGISQRRGWLPYKEVMEGTTISSNHEICDTLSSELMNIFFTSGTTGFPKMTQHTHSSYGLGHITTGKYWLGLTSKDIMWNMSDTGWAKAYWSSLFAPWSEGATVFVHHTPRFDAKRTLQVMNQCNSLEIWDVGFICMLQVLSLYPITTLCSAPTSLRMLVQEDVRNFHFPALRQVVSAGEPLVSAGNHW
jgi:medium-chain acyl-CoA synthetase